VMFAARWIIGWRISRRMEGVANNSASQFSLKFLILLTTICAGLLVIGRGVLANERWAESAFWNQVGNGLLFVGLMLVTLFPLLILPLIAIAQRPSKRILAATLFSWAGLTWLIVEIAAAEYSEPRTDIARQLTLIQGGALVATLLSALALRYAGYRLISISRRSSQESVASA